MCSSSSPTQRLWYLNPNELGRRHSAKVADSDLKDLKGIKKAKSMARCFAVVLVGWFGCLFVVVDLLGVQNYMTWILDMICLIYV